MTTLALFDIVKKTGKFRIVYAYREGKDVTAQVNVLFEGICFQVYFEGKYGQEIKNHNEHLYLDFDLF